MTKLRHEISAIKYSQSEMEEKVTVMLDRQLKNIIIWSNSRLRNIVISLIMGYKHHKETYYK